MTKSPNFVRWSHREPPVFYVPTLRFSLQCFSATPRGIPDRCRLVLLTGYGYQGGETSGYPVCRSYCGHAGGSAVSCLLRDCIARFEFLPPLSVVEALAESLGLTLVWPDVAEGDEPSGQEDAA